MCIRDSAKEHGIHRTNLVITYVVFEVVQFKLSHQLDHQGSWAPISGYKSITYAKMHNCTSMGK